jgi:predicted RNA binding protein YcfA (HicA-like mRNA interferase family)
MIHDIAEMHGLTATETTTASNGYPQGLRYALTDFESITQLKDLADQLTAEGREVEEVILHKRDGWQLWARSNGSVTHGMYRQQSSNDWTVDIAPNDDTHEIARELVGIVEDSSEELTNIAERFAKYLKNEQRQDMTVTVFYDPNQNYRVDYCATDETTGYSYDTHSYKVGLLIY